MDGAGLIFDFDTTEFGPNLGFDRDDSYGGYMVQVMSGGSVEFAGEMVATGLEDMRSVFWNDDGGSIKFVSNVVFDNCDTNIFRDNFGRLRFYGDVTFTDNKYLSINNLGGSVRIDGDASFVNNGGAFEGQNGGAFANTKGGTAIFRGRATFSGNNCDEAGGGVFNGGDSKMTFYKKTGFYDNSCYEEGGGIKNAGGVLKFRGAVVASGNEADETGGGIATTYGGTTTFYGWTTIESNTAFESGGGLSVEGQSDNGSVVTFKDSSKIRIGDNESNGGCNNVYVEDNSELVGYDSETISDICD